MTPLPPAALALLLAAWSFPLTDTNGLVHTHAQLRAAGPLARLARNDTPKGFVFYAVDSNRASERKSPIPTLTDPKRELGSRAHIQSAPGAAVFSPRGQSPYSGPLNAQLTAAFNRAAQPKPPSPPTFAREIAPILYKHCAICHHPGEVAPFPLLTYQDAAKRAKLIATVTASRYMPPWQPAPGYGHFQGDRRLPAADIAMLRRWADAGAPEGDPARVPPAPHFPSGWQLGTPDMIVRMPKPFSVAADGPDQYMCFDIPLHLTSEKYVRGLEFRPGERSVVHHALFLLDSGHIARQFGESYPCFGTPGFLPSGALGGWTPGMQPARMPDGLQLILTRNSDLVMQIHYHPTGKAETDQSALGLYFTDKPPTRWVIDIALGSHQIDIPPGDRTYKVRDHFTLPVDVYAVGIIPHAHYICKEMDGWALLPNGRKIWLIKIRDWNFDWQEQYRYATPLRLPADTDVRMEFTYDNSADNPRNPNHPPQRVMWGPSSTDEMAGLHLQVTPVKMSDWHELGQALWGKFMRSVGGGIYRKPQ